MLRESIREVHARRPFQIKGIALLHDHLHVIVQLPAGDSAYGPRVSQIKKGFTQRYLSAGGKEGATTPSRLRHRVRGVWEKRFWEHTIRDWGDFVLHLEYIHMNPVQHGLVSRPIDWPWSSFRRYVAAGWYAEGWCGSIDLPGRTFTEPT